MGSLQKKCGEKAAGVAMETAKIAGDKLKEARAQARVKADQGVAKEEAVKANKAMAAARAAAAEKETSKAALTAAQGALKKVQAEAKALNEKSKLARASAKKLAESGGSNAAVKEG